MNRNLIEASDALAFDDSGFPFVSFYLFVRGFNGTHEEFLGELGLTTYRRACEAEERESFIFVVRKGDWIGLLENWGMRLQFCNELRSRTEALGTCYPVVTAWVGDCDHTFGFRHFDGGGLRRAFAQGDPSWGDSPVEEDVGVTLAFEGHFKNFADEAERLPFVASQFEVPSDWKDSDIMSYTRPGLIAELKKRFGDVWRRRRGP